MQLEEFPMCYLFLHIYFSAGREPSASASAAAEAAAAAAAVAVAASAAAASAAAAAKHLNFVSQYLRCVGVGESAIPSATPLALSQ
jgi:hypothetical protein